MSGGPVNGKVASHPVIGPMYRQPVYAWSRQMHIVNTSQPSQQGRAERAERADKRNARPNLANLANLAEPSRAEPIGSV